MQWCFLLLYSPSTTCASSIKSTMIAIYRAQGHCLYGSWIFESSAKRGLATLLLVVVLGWVRRANHPTSLKFLVFAINVNCFPVFFQNPPSNHGNQNGMSPHNLFLEIGYVMVISSFDFHPMIGWGKGRSAGVFREACCRTGWSIPTKDAAASATAAAATTMDAATGDASASKSTATGTTTHAAVARDAAASTATAFAPTTFAAASTPTAFATTTYAAATRDASATTATTPSGGTATEAHPKKCWTYATHTHASTPKMPGPTRAPGVQPAAPGVQPAAPGVQPAPSGVQPAAPGVQPAAPGVQPEEFHQQLQEFNQQCKPHCATWMSMKKCNGCRSAWCKWHSARQSLHSMKLYKRWSRVYLCQGWSTWGSLQQCRPKTLKKEQHS